MTQAPEIASGGAGALLAAYRTGFNDGHDGDWNPDTFLARMAIDAKAASCWSGLNIKAFAGEYYVWRWSSHGLRRKAGGKPLPKRRHFTRESAEAEAARLSAEWPDSTFIILQGVGRVKATASAIETRSAETAGLSPEGESAAPKVDAQPATPKETPDVE